MIMEIVATTAITCIALVCLASLLAILGIVVLLVVFLWRRSPGIGLEDELYHRGPQEELEG